MTTTPNGSPAWTRSSDYVTYGGDPSKANYQSQGVVNPRTDVGAEAFARLVADTASVMRTCEFASMTIVCDDVTPGPPTVQNCRLMTGVTAISYVGDAPPAGFPSVARNGDGDVTVTFDASYTDPYGVSGDFIAQDPVACLTGSTPGVANPELVSDTEVRVRAAELDGDAATGATFTLTVGSGT
jgi:hypothetical protein